MIDIIKSLKGNNFTSKISVHGSYAQTRRVLTQEPLYRQLKMRFFDDADDLFAEIRSICSEPTEQGCFSENDIPMTCLLLALQEINPSMAEISALEVNKKTNWQQWRWAKNAMLECSQKLRQAHGLE